MCAVMVIDPRAHVEWKCVLRRQPDTIRARVTEHSLSGGLYRVGPSEGRLALDQLVQYHAEGVHVHLQWQIYGFRVLKRKT